MLLTFVLLAHVMTQLYERVSLATLPKHTYVGGNLPTLIAKVADKPSSLAVASMCSLSKYPKNMKDIETYMYG